ncbi:MAG: helix-turn-helix domain-containing protein [Candidatus Bathyarchaeia archaeon]
MTYGRIEKEQAPEIILKEAGFTISERCRSRPSCFDFAARKNEKLILVKFRQDIDSIPPTDLIELKAISRCIFAASLIISSKTREKPLEDDTVYSRYDVYAVTPKTFENAVQRKIYPLIHAGPGGYYVEIDGETIRRKRQELGLSVGEMAEMIGISRRTLYGYERGMAKASVTVAYNLICALGVPVAKPVNLFETRETQRSRFSTTAKLTKVKNKLLQKIFRKFTRCRITAVNKAPFDFIINVPEEKIKILGGVTEENEKTLDRRVDEILSVSNVVRAHPVLITEQTKQLKKDIVCIDEDELSKIKKPEDLISKF